MWRAPGWLTIPLVLSLLLSACAIQPIRPEVVGPAAASTPAAPAPGEATEKELATLAEFEMYAALFKQHPMTLANLEEFLAYYADDAVLHFLSSPAPDETYAGKPAIRAYYQTHDASDNTVTPYEVLGVEGDTVFTRFVNIGDSNAESGMEPFTGIEIFVVRDGLIVDDTWAMDPDSLAVTFDAIAAAGREFRADKAPTAATAVVDAAMAPAQRGPLDSGSIEETLAWYAADVVFTMLGLPGGPQVYEGKEALRARMEEWAAVHTRVQFDAIAASEGEVVGRSTVWDDKMEALGVAPLVATEEIEVEEGLIQRETWILSPDSYVALRDAMKGTAAP